MYQNARQDQKDRLNTLLGDDSNIFEDQIAAESWIIQAECDAEELANLKRSIETIMAEWAVLRMHPSLLQFVFKAYPAIYTYLNVSSKTANF